MPNGVSRGQDVPRGMAEREECVVRGSRLGWVAGLLALVAVFGALATHSAPDGGHGIGIWPIGGATACFMISPRPRTWALVGLVGLIGVGSIWIGGPGPQGAIGPGIGPAAAGRGARGGPPDGRPRGPPPPA